MKQTRPELLHRSAASFLSPSSSPIPFSHYVNFPFRPTNHYSLCSAHKTWIAQLSEQLSAAAAAAVTSAPPPTEIPPQIVSASNDLTALQTATAVLLTGTFTLFLFRSLRRRAKRAKQARLRSLGTLKSPRKAKSPPSPDEAFLGAMIAAAFGILLYKFTTSIEYSLNHQPLSNNYSVRQITITIRTIINGLCYLATFVFFFNSIGLFLYSGQLAINSNSEGSRSKGGAPLNSSSFSKPRDDVESSEITGTDEDQSSDKTPK